jgi:hypothetical protein
LSIRAIAALHYSLSELKFSGDAIIFDRRRHGAPRAFTPSELSVDNLLLIRLFEFLKNNSTSFEGKPKFPLRDFGLHPHTSQHPHSDSGGG